MERASILKVGGACAILYVIVALLIIVPLATAGILEDVSAAELLPIAAQSQGAIATAGWLFILAPILLSIAGLGIYHALRQGGSLMLLAVLAFSGGSLLIIYRGSLFVAMAYELAPAYVVASASAQETLAIFGDTLIMFGTGADYVGAALIAGIGLPIFCLGILRTRLAPKWVAWLGFVAAIVGGWMTFLRPLGEVFEMLELLGGLLFFIWMVIIGIVIWRIPTPTEE